ncbi:MAG: ABC transporter substrate-binding protein [Alcaligenes nematophilus]|uniref:ABC transporter substrate-binding protein n=1 Tax=Alcaligenes nematophilus TaxID=2994643 RepID=UPI003D03BDA4
MKRRDILRALAALPVLAPHARLLARSEQAGTSRSISLHVSVAGKLPDPAQVGRIVAAGPPASVLVYCLAPHALLGWPFQLAPAARSMMEAAGFSLPYLGRLAGRGSTLSLENLLALKPDMVVDIGDVNPYYESAAKSVQEQTGVPYVLLDGRLNDSPAQLRQAGHILGQAERGQQLALRAQAILDTAHQAANPRAKGLKAYLARGNDGLETGMGQSIHTEVLRLCSLTVMGDEKTDNRLGRISYEQLLAWDPDMLFAQDDAFFELARTQAPWNQLKAVKEGRLYRVPALPFGWLDGPPGINRLAGVIWLNALLEGSAAMPRMYSELQEFYSAFYGMSLSDEQVKRLVQGLDPLGSQQGG